MSMLRKSALALSTALLASTFSAAVAVTPADAAAKPAWTKNCTALNKKYPHGVGMRNARDKTSSGTPVRNFTKSDKTYKLAMSHNKGLDRDKDKVACEKK